VCDLAAEDVRSLIAGAPRVPVPPPTSGLNFHCLYPGACMRACILVCAVRAAGAGGEGRTQLVVFEVVCMLTSPCIRFPLNTRHAHSHASPASLALIPLAAIDAPADFGLLARLHGPGGSYLTHISSATGAECVVRGRGSAAGGEGQEPLHIYVSSGSREHLEEARRRVFLWGDEVRGRAEVYERVWMGLWRLLLLHGDCGRPAVAAGVHAAS
jgi:hypothetical protein